MSEMCCPKCKGKGRAKLSGKMQRTLDAMPVGEEVTTKQIRDAAKIPGQRDANSTAINNRLVVLEKGALITSRMVGHTKLWTRIP